MTDDEPDKETVSIKDLLNTLISRLTGIEDTQRELREGQKEANQQQQQVTVQLTKLNGTVAKLQERSTSHSGKLHDQGGVLIDHTARLAVVERVTELRAAHQAQGIRDAGGDAWAAQQTAHDVRAEAIGWAREIRMAAISAGFVLLGLLVIVAVVVMAFR